MKLILLSLIICSCSTNGLVSIDSTNPHKPLLTTGFCVGMKNDSSQEVSYFYTNKDNNGQNRWYEHTISRITLGQWDWGWSNTHQKNSIEFQTYNNQHNKWETIVISYQGYFSSEQGYGAHFNIYFNSASPMSLKNPEWNANIWNVVHYDVLEWDGNWHMGLTFEDDGVIAGQYQETSQYIFHY